MSSLVLRPGLLVSLSVRARGGVHYDHGTRDREEAGQVVVEKWQTTKIVDDQKEHEAAEKVRSRCRSMVTSVCAQTAFGPICPADRETVLDAAIKDAREVAETFNKVARTVQVEVYVLKGRVAESDTEAAQAVAAEMRGILAEMEDGVRRLDVEAVRDAAKRAREMSAVLSEDAGKKVTAAISQARKAANEIARRIDRGGEDAAVVINEIKIDDVLSARRYLDVDVVDTPPVQIETLPSAPRPLDVDAEADTEAAGDGEAVEGTKCADLDVDLPGEVFGLEALATIEGRELEV